MLNLFDTIFKTTKNLTGNPSTPKQLTASVRVIGDRASGKTTYMAALARWPNSDPSISPVQQITPINEDGEELILKARNILEEGEQLEPTPANANITEVKDYGISILLKKQYKFFHRKNGNASLIAMNINCKDYAGEIFSDLVYKSGNQRLEDYLEDCRLANGIMLLLDGLSYAKDGEYANGIEKLLTELDRAGGTNSNRRIALVLSKCEQSDLWINRQKPTEIAQARFKQVLTTLRSWQQMGGGEIDCFMTSAFGMLGDIRPKPNMVKIRRDRDGLQESVLKNPKQWKPFGLVAPLYWLCSGERHRDLELI